MLALGLVLALGSAIVWLGRRGVPTVTSAGASWPRVLALALIAALLARFVARTIIALPAGVWVALVLGLGLAALRSRRIDGFALTIGAALALLGCSALAGIAGAAFEAGGPQPHGAARSGPIIGVHPRQAIAVRIDGFGPHDILADDFVEPDVSDGRPGHDPASWAERLELELHTIAALHYEQGPARARAAFSGAQVDVVDAVVPPGDEGSYEALLGLEIRSGTIGEGSMVELVCPGQVIDPRGPSVLPMSACPRKYVQDGSTGLGVAARWPGYTEVRGRARARLARLLGWPSGSADRDRRLLALELGLLTGVFVLLAAAIQWVTRRTSEPSGPGTFEAAATLGISLAFVSALLISPPSGGPTTTTGSMLSTLALLLVLPLPSSGPSPEVPQAPCPTLRQLAGPSDHRAGLLVIPLVLLLGLSPLAGVDLLGSPALGEGTLAAWTDALVLGAGFGWSTAGALAVTGALTLVMPALLASLAALRSEGAGSRLGMPWRVVMLLGFVILLGLRKPGDDAALLVGALALLLAADLARATASRPALGLLGGLGLAFAVAQGLVERPRDLVATLVLAGLSLLVLVVASRSAKSAASGG